jgi:hypothetical protein
MTDPGVLPLASPSRTAIPHHEAKFMPANPKIQGKTITRPIENSEFKIQNPKLKISHLAACSLSIAFLWDGGFGNLTGFATFFRAFPLPARGAPI